MVVFYFFFIENWFLCKYEHRLPKVYFEYSSWTSFRDPPFDSEFKSLKILDFLMSLSFKSHIFEPRKYTDSVPRQTKFTLFSETNCYYKDYKDFLETGTISFLLLNTSVSRTCIFL